MRFFSAAILVFLPIFFQNCSPYKTRAAANVAIEEPGPDEIVAKVLTSNKVIVELAVTFAASDPFESRLVTASINRDTGVMSIDNSSLRRSDGLVVNACTVAFNDGSLGEVIDHLASLVSGGSNALNSDGLNYELSVSDLHGNAVRQFLAGSPLAAGQRLLFLNGETLTQRLLELANCSN